MHRHEVEPGDDLIHTTMRHGDAVRLTPCRADGDRGLLRRLLPRRLRDAPGRPGDLPAVAAAVADYFADPAERRRWDVVDLRRLRCGDPAATHWRPPSERARSPRAGCSTSSARTSARSSTCQSAASMDDYLGTLGKKERHEIRRKVRRAEAVGEVA